ncbi:hypothetical protein RclHR1_05380004 [Rhizophagus clarus]|uniref:Mating-type HMG-box protein MAT1-2 n=1 Tax=Rhizophagus clarus TaxID=94130 RepID=A0A2Z6SEQ7_9GLOM|nr:hypothetical protein RclHR1_05380004 [Rhizophagus clarus]GES99425.1 mating-type HMG-box protein MAT1-2 [Rhizophagus clarus]
MVLIFHDELISSQELHPLLSNPPYHLTKSIAELTTPKIPKEKRRSHVTDSEEDIIIPRPHNAFIIFRNDFAAKVKNSHDKKISIRVISQMASKQWKEESEIVKLFFKLLADMYQHKHRILYPDYKYSPRYNAARRNRKKKSGKSDDKREDLKDKKKGRIITWYIHDHTDKDLHTQNTNDTFRYTDLNISNSEDLKIEPLDLKPKSYPPATFINYTATATSPLVLHSTTTTCSQPAPPPINFHHYNANNEALYNINNDIRHNDINNVNDFDNDMSSDNGSSTYDDNALSPLSFIPIEPLETSSPSSSPPSNDCMFWTESSNNNERDVPSSPFGLSLFDLTDEQNIFEI